jgi:hypothetical protein
LQPGAKLLARLQKFHTRLQKCTLTWPESKESCRQNFVDLKAMEGQNVADGEAVKAVRAWADLKMDFIVGSLKELQKI